MDYEIYFQPSYALLKVNLSAGEGIVAESGAMVSMSDGVEVETSTRGGLFSAFKRVLGGESVFLNTFRANIPAEVTLAPVLPGDIYPLQLNGDGWIGQPGSFLAADEGITIDSRFGGLKTIVGGEGVFLLKFSGTGMLFLSSYGGIYKVDLQPQQKYIVDTGHMVAFTDTTQYTIRRVGSWKSTFLSGEGLVFEFTGPGTVLIQTRNFSALRAAVAIKR